MVKRFGEYLLLEVIHGPTDFKSNRDYSTRIWGETEAEMNHHELPNIHPDIIDKHGKALENYISYSGNLNRHLHETYAEDRSVYHSHGTISPIYHDTVKSLDHATKSYPTSHDFHVYTGLQGSPWKIGGSNSIKHDITGTEHSKAFLPAYTSTSLSPNVANSFAEPSHGESGAAARHLLKISIPKGSTHGIYVGKDIAPKVSNRIHEREFLISRGKKIHIHKEPEIIKNPNNSDYDTHIWHAHIVE